MQNELLDIVRHFDLQGRVLDIAPLGSGLINGDTYYKIKYPEHNLVRTRNQLALFKAASAKVPQMSWLWET